MPIDKEEFNSGQFHSEMEAEVVSFLKERKEGAFTSQEIMAGLHYPTDFSTPEVAKISTFVIADFTSLLYDLAKSGKIKTKVVRGRMHFMARGDDMAKCPKCGIEFAAKKTWKMAGRPNKKGERLQLQIGLFKCSKHGTFRAVLAKRKI